VESGLQDIGEGKRKREGERERERERESSVEYILQRMKDVPLLLS